MKIIITNDDGPFTPCLKVWPSVLKDVADVKIVVPNQERSTSGHGLTLTRPLEVREIEENFFIVDGLPADCAFLSTSSFFNDGPPDLVISGINRGGNLGQDIYYSGTAAAAREAAFRNVPALAVSLTMELTPQYYSDSEGDYLLPCHIIRKLIEGNICRLIPPLFFLNVNIPCVTPIKGGLVTSLGFRHYRGDVHLAETPRKKRSPWINSKYHGFEEKRRSDCQTIDNHFVSITPLGPSPSLSYPYMTELENLLQDIKFSI